MGSNPRSIGQQLAVGLQTLQDESRLYEPGNTDGRSGHVGWNSTPWLSLSACPASTRHSLAAYIPETLPRLISTSHTCTSSSQGPNVTDATSTLFCSSHTHLDTGALLCPPNVADALRRSFSTRHTCTNGSHSLHVDNRPGICPSDHLQCYLPLRPCRQESTGGHYGQLDNHHDSCAPSSSEEGNHHIWATLQVHLDQHWCILPLITSH